MASVIVGATATLATLVQAVALANVLASAWSTQGRQVSSTTVTWLLVGIGLRAATALLGEPLAQRAASAATVAMRAELVGRLAASPEPERGRAAAVALLTRGVDAVNLYLARYLPALVLAAVSPLLVLAWVAWADPMSAVIVLATVLVLPVFMVLLGREAAERMGEAFSHSARLTGHFGDVLAGMADLRAFNREGAQVEVLDAVGVELRRSTMATLRIALLSSFTLELLASLATALVALSLGIRLIGGHVGLATALAVLVVTPEVYLPLRRASAQFHEATEGVGASAELLGRLEAMGAASGEAVVPSAPRIALLGLALPEGRGAAELSLSLEPGAHLQLVGASGSGKSSVLAVLMAAAEPAYGRLELGGVPAGAIDPLAWRERVAWLPQAPTFPGRTVLEALTLRAPWTPRGEVLGLVDALGLGELATRPRWLDASAREALAELSTGQRHRLALVRAVLGPADLLLLDEPFAHLDAETAELVADAIGQRWPGTTTVVALHEPTSLLAFDQTVSLDRGGDRAAR